MTTLKQMRDAFNKSKQQTIRVLAVLESIKHWERMINWAKKQNSKSSSLAGIMYVDIKEGWFEEDCELCKINSNCQTCFLFKYDNMCDEPGSAWNKVHRSKTWKQWLINAKKMLELLNKIFEKETKLLK